MGAVMRGSLLGLSVASLALSAASTPLDRDVTLLDIEQALAIARSRDSERAAFHAPYIQRLETPFVEAAEVITEFRRVVLLAEERARKGERMFTYSASLAQQAAAPWRLRVAVVARLRFHPQNTYVGLPEVDLALPARPEARIGVLKEPILGFASKNPADRLPVLGGVVEGVFDAAALSDAPYEFVMRVDKKEVGRVTFDLAAVR
jgi:hypothetical protein